MFIVRGFVLLYSGIIRLDNVDFPTLFDQDNLLVSHIDEKEINEAVSQCASFKSVTLDGFNFHFIKNAWVTFKKNIIQVMNYF